MRSTTSAARSSSPKSTRATKHSPKSTPKSTSAPTLPAALRSPELLALVALVKRFRGTPRPTGGMDDPSAARALVARVLELLVRILVAWGTGPARIASNVLEAGTARAGWRMRPEDDREPPTDTRTMLADEALDGVAFARREVSDLWTMARLDDAPFADATAAGAFHALRAIELSLAERDERPADASKAKVAPAVDARTMHGQPDAVLATVRAALTGNAPARAALDVLEADLARWRTVLGSALERLARTREPTIALLLSRDEDAGDNARDVAGELVAVRVDVDEVVRDLTRPAVAAEVAS